jgi:hypothetical protein
MSQVSDDQYQGEGKSVEEAAEAAARKVPKEIQQELFELAIYARLSGEHNPVHDYIVVLNPGGP